MKAILLNRIILVLAFVGLFVAGVLSIEAATGANVPCGTGGGCAVVASHPSSKLFGTLPVAYLGLIGYLGLAGLAAMRAFQGVHRSRPLVTVGYALAAVGTLASLGLQYVAFFVIRATCLWCLSSALLMIALLVLHAMLTQELDAHPEAPDRPAGPGIDLPLVAGLPLVLGIALAVMNSQMSVPPAINLPKEVLANVEFVPEGANTYGQPDSPLTIVEFADILCPACQNTSPLVKDFVTENSGKVRLVYRHFPLDKIHPQAMAAAAISEVAADQGKFWDFTLAVMSYGKQPESPDELLQLASQVGLDSDMVRARLQNSEDKAYADVANDLKTVKELGIISTPTFFLLSDGKVIGKPLGPRDIMPRLQEAEIQAIMNGKKS